MNELAWIVRGLIAEICLTLVPIILVIWIGWGVSRLASRAAASQQRHEYPTEQFLGLTYQESLEQWTPAPTIEPPAVL